METRQFITFQLGEEFFGIDILLVQEINRNMDIVEVSRGADYVCGLQNLRGQIVTVLDLGVRLGLGKRDLNEISSCIVLKPNKTIHDADNGNEVIDRTTKDLVGFLVDRIGDVVTVNVQDIEAASMLSHEVSSQFLDGVVKLDGRLLVTLNAYNILVEEEEGTTKTRQVA